MTRRNPPLTAEQIHHRLVVDCEAGKCYWRDPSKFHPRLHGAEAGYPRIARGGRAYWVIKLDGVPYKRAQIILAISSGRWPDDVVDHKNRDPLDDRADNLRHATLTQNAWNHGPHTKRSTTPPGVRRVASGRFQARIGYQKRLIVIGIFDSQDAASAAYQSKRKELFHAYS